MIKLSASAGSFDVFNPGPASIWEAIDQSLEQRSTVAMLGSRADREALARFGGKCHQLFRGGKPCSGAVFVGTILDGNARRTWSVELLEESPPVSQARPKCRWPMMRGTEDALSGKPPNPEGTSLERTHYLIGYHSAT